MSRDITPLAVVERLFGGIDRIGPVVGLHVKTVFAWRHPTKWRDAGDIPSARAMRALLAHARATGIPLTAEHLIFGADAAEIEALLPGEAPTDASAPAQHPHPVAAE